MKSYNIAPNFPFIIIIPLLLVIFLFTACQPTVITPFSEPTSSTLTAQAEQSESETKTPSPLSSPTSAYTPTPLPSPTLSPDLQITDRQLNGTEINFWHPWTGLLEQQITTLTDEFNQDNEWNITVNITAPGSSMALYSALEDMDKNEAPPPNLIAAPIEHILFFQSQSEEPVFINLEGYSTHSQRGFTEQEIADFPKIIWEQGYADDYLYSIPAQQTLEVIFYNKTWAEELGFKSAPETPIEFEQQACAAANAILSDNDEENNGTGGWIVNYEHLNVLSWMEAFGYNDLPEKDSDTYVFNTQENIEMFSFLRRIFDQDCAWTSRLPQPHEYFANRLALFYSGTLQDIADQERTNKHLNSTDEWQILPFPSNAEKPTILTSGLSYAILESTPEEQMAAWLFAKWIVKPENQVQQIQVSNTLPINVSTINQLEVYGKYHPQWQESLHWTPMTTTTPKLASWKLAQVVLEDAAWQVFQSNTTKEDIPNILEILDSTILELTTLEE